jgi:hypothetical protein
MIPEKCVAVFRKDHAQKRNPPVTAGAKFKGGSAVDEALVRVSLIRWLAR